ncbi:MAG: winged helix-turn-helix transcriptional regulator [Nanoarchaeota archaeon]
MFDLQTFIEKFSFLDRILGKWYFLILLALVVYETSNFYMLKKRTKLSSKVLSTKLRFLKSAKLVGEEILVEKPKRVRYYITEEGKRFVEGLSETFGIDLPHSADRKI